MSTVKEDSLYNELTEMTDDKNFFANKSKELSKLLTERDIKISDLENENKILRRFVFAYRTSIGILTFLIIIYFIWN